MSQTETPLTPPLRPGPLYPLLPDESDDILVDVVNMVPNAALWLDTRNSSFGWGHAAVGDRHGPGMVPAQHVADGPKYGQYSYESRRLFVAAHRGWNGRCGIGPSSRDTPRPPLATAHTVFTASRFNPATPSGASLSGAISSRKPSRHPLRSGGHLRPRRRPGCSIPNPQAAWLIINVRVAIQRVADLTDSGRTNQTGDDGPRTHR